MKCRANLATMRTSVVRALSFSAAFALTLNPVLTPAIAADYRPVAQVAADGQMNARFLSLGVGKSIVIDLPRDIKDVLVADPKIANAVVRSSQRAYIIGASVGQTNIVFFDPPASRSRPMTSRSSATSTACAPRSSRSCPIPTSRSTGSATVSS